MAVGLQPPLVMRARVAIVCAALALAALQNAPGKAGENATPPASTHSDRPASAKSEPGGRAPSEESERHCLARTLYWEAGTDGRDGMIAVAWVILNRTRDGEYPHTICGVVKQGGQHPGCQFSSWCDGKSDKPKPDEHWNLAEEIAREMLADPPPDPTNGAMFYHTVDSRPAWVKSHRLVARIGQHLYYR